MGLRGPKPQPIEHGTYSGYTKHYRRGDTECPEPSDNPRGACWAARDRYLEDLRNRGKDERADARRLRVVEERALRKLGQRHPQELVQLIKEESARG